MIYPDDDCCGRDDMLLILFKYLIFIILFPITFFNIKFAQCLVRVWEDSKRERDDRDLPIAKCHQHRHQRMPLETSIVDTDRGAGSSKSSETSIEAADERTWTENVTRSTPIKAKIVYRGRR